MLSDLSRLPHSDALSFHHYLETQLGCVSKALFTGCCHDVSCLCGGSWGGYPVQGIANRYFPSGLILFQVQRHFCGTPPLEDLSLNESRSQETSERPHLKVLYSFSWVCWLTHEGPLHGGWRQESWKFEARPSYMRMRPCFE